MSINIDSTKKVTFTGKDGAAYNSKKRSGTIDVYALPLAAEITNGLPIKNNPIATAYFTDAFVGGFKMNNTLGGTYRSTNARLAYNPAGNSIFTTEQTRSIAEIQMPAIETLTKDNSTFPLATVKLQDWVSFIEDDTKIPNRIYNYNDIGGITLDKINGGLYVQAYIWYSGGSTSSSFFKIADHTNLSTSPVLGAWETSSPKDYDTSWMQELPAVWKAEFNASHVFGNGAGMSNKERASSGASAYMADLASFDTSNANAVLPTQCVVVYEKVNDNIWSLGTGTSLYQGNATGTVRGDDPAIAFNHVRENYDQYNNFNNWDANQGVDKWDIDNNDVGVGNGNHYNAAHVVKGNNDVWTELSSAAGGFIISGTRTYCAIGEMGGGESGAGYKLGRYDDQGVYLGAGGGGSTVDPADRLGYYWLYDMKDLMEATDIGSVPPYAYGTLPLFDGIPGTPRTATYDPEDGVLLIAVSGGVFSEEGAADTSVLRFQLPSD